MIWYHGSYLGMIYTIYVIVLFIHLNLNFHSVIGFIIGYHMVTFKKEKIISTIQANKTIRRSAMTCYNYESTN